ncbi:MAG: multicopper oxidase domain-containing protein [Candidatus Solibacter sp.]
MSQPNSDTPSRRQWLTQIAATVSGATLAGALPAAESPEPADAAATCPARGGVPEIGGTLPEIAEIASGPDRVLRATITVDDEVRSVWMFRNNPENPFQLNPPVCREGHPMRYFAGAPTGGKRVWPVAKGVPAPGPTLRARVGDTVQITLLNHVDAKSFPNTLDLAEQGKSTGCDVSTTLLGDPGQEERQQVYPMADVEPDCFHGSSTANLHFHGFHISPGTIGDNVLVQVRPSPRDPKTNQPLITEATVRKSFQEVFDMCGHGHNPRKWEDMPRAWRDTQDQLLKAYDAQVPIAKLWEANQKAIAAGEWPQYHIGGYASCFRITPEKMPLGADGETVTMAQSPGTFWYHSHKHGSTALNSLNGMAGAFIVEGDYDDKLRAFYAPQKLEEKVLVLQQYGPGLNLQTTPAPNASRQGTQQGQLVFVNGLVEPVLKMRPGQVQLWRVLNACHQAGVAITAITPATAQALAAAGKGAAGSATFQWKQTAQDGIQLSWGNFSAESNRNPRVMLSPANRADFLVQAPSAPGIYEVQADVMPTIPGVPFAPLMIVQVEGEPVQTALGFPARQQDFPTLPSSLKDIDPATTHLRRQLTFDTLSFRGNGQPGQGQALGRAGYPGMRPSLHTIDGEQFQNNRINHVVLQDTCEEWLLINTTRIPQVPPPLMPPPPAGTPPRPADAPPPISPLLAFAHPFHIHVNPFQVVEIFDPITMDEPKVYEKDFVWYDTIGIPPAYNYYPNGKPRLDREGKQTWVNGYVRFRSRFADFSGLFVLHCHILAHEDRGMMQLVQVVPAKTVAEHYH